MKAKIKVRASFDRDAVEIHQINGWETLSKRHGDLNFDEIEFDTMAEAKAYVRGICDGNGWDSPFTEIVEAGPTEQVTARVLFDNNDGAIVLLSDGGVATFHHNGSHMQTTYYQERATEEEISSEVIDFERLSEGNVDLRDWSDKDSIDNMMIFDAVEWLAPFCNVTIVRVQPKSSNQ